MPSNARVVLLVDDHAGIRALVRTLFELDRPGDEILEAATASRALDLWRRRRPDVILLDEMLGHDRGLDTVAAAIRDQGDDVPIVLFTAFVDDATRTRAAELGVGECVTQDDIQLLPTIVERLAN
ncbi:MAG: two-component system, NarL family, invasion response regulator UvrY [Actinomycetota bacterium]